MSNNSSNTCIIKNKSIASLIEGYKLIIRGVDIGQYTQKQIDLMMNHINFYARKKHPYYVFAFQYGEDILKAFNLEKVTVNQIILNPKLLK